MPDDEPTTDAHFYVLLDRSGSMQAIAPQVVAGFNQFIHDQAAEGGDAVVSLIQFDDHDPHEVVADASPIHDIVDLDHATFQPRGTTPLWDAIGRVIGRAEGRVAQRQADGDDPEDITVVIVTDGHENASQEFTLAGIRALIDKKQDDDGWGFVYLSSDLDAYEDAAAMGFDQRSVSQWVPDGRGAGLAFDSLSKSAARRRADRRTGKQFEKKDFFAGEKHADVDRRQRSGPRTGRRSGPPVGVFLYGTLMPGHSRWDVIERFVRDFRPATVTGKLFDTGLGFPAARFDREGEVHGVLCSIAPGRTEPLRDALRQIGGDLYESVEVATRGGRRARAQQWRGDTTGLTPIEGRWSGSS